MYWLKLNIHKLSNIEYYCSFSNPLRIRWRLCLTTTISVYAIIYFLLTHDLTYYTTAVLIVITEFHKWLVAYNSLVGKQQFSNVIETTVMCLRFEQFRRNERNMRISPFAFKDVGHVLLLFFGNPQPCRNCGFYLLFILCFDEHLAEPFAKKVLRISLNRSGLLSNVSHRRYSISIPNRTPSAFYDRYFILTFLDRPKTVYKTLFFDKIPRLREAVR